MPELSISLDGSVIRSPVAGVQRAVREQLIALLEVGPARAMTIYAMDAPVREAAARAGAALGSVPAFARRAAMRILWQQLRLPALLKQTGAQVLFAPAYTAPLRCPVPWVLQMHDVIAFDHPEYCSGRNVRHMRSLAPKSVRGAAAILTPSRAVADAVRRTFGVPADRIHAVPLGVDFERFSNARAVASDDSALVRQIEGAILFVGNLEPKKGLGVLVEAYGRCAGRLNRDLVLVGRPAWKSRAVLRAVQQYTGPGRIRCIGRVSDELLPTIYRAAAVFVFPSLVEGFGLPVLEAMAAGTPVIHSDDPSVLETAGDAAVRVPRGDAEALAAALFRLSESAELATELKGRGLERAKELTWHKWAESVLPILKKARRGE